MSVDEFNKKLDAKILAIKTQNKPLELAVRSVMTLQASRIFINGKNKDGGNIGEYVKKPVYISPDKYKSLPSFPLNGKPDKDGKTSDKKATVYDVNTRVKKRIKVKESGEDRKTGYFENFLEFKKAVGRNKKIQTVDFFLTGDLQRDWANAENLKDAKANKISQDHYNISLNERNYLKVERYDVEGGESGKVFSLSNQERVSFKEVCQFELKKALQ